MKQLNKIKTIKNIGALGLAAFILIGCQGGDLKSKQRTVDYLTTSEGRSLYIFDEDELNKSNCDSDCQTRWTKYEGVVTHSDDLNTFDDTHQLAYRKHPLYTFNMDEKEGDVKGDNFKTTWHLIYAPNTIDDHQARLSKTSMKQTYLTDAYGRALYTFDKDKIGESSCYAGCENIWPAYYAPVVVSVPSELDKQDFGTIDRDREKVVSGVYRQTTYQGKPLYYFHKDLGQAHTSKGDWVGGLWDVVEINAHKTHEKAAPRFPVPDKISEEGLTEKQKSGRDLFYNPKRGSCFKCHGSDGNSQPPSKHGVPINNVITRFDDANVIKERLLDMKNNPNSGRDTSMIIGAKALTNKEIEEVSSFMATLEEK